MVDSAIQPSAASVWRREVVQPLLRAYSAERDVRAVLLGGSAARGDADRWSDVEVGVFWSAAPTDGARSRLADLGGARDGRLFAYDERERVWCDDLYLGARPPDGLLVEVVHTLTGATEQLLHAALVDHSPDPVGLNVLQGLLDGSAVHGVEIITRWRRRAAQYPRALSVAVVESAGVIDHFWRWEMLSERRNPILIAGLFSSVSQQLLDILLALNRRYGPKIKWLDSLACSLDIVPPNLADRVRGVFADDPPIGARALAGLVDETFALVERELPEVDVDRLRRIFHHRRAPLDRPPSV